MCNGLSELINWVVILSPKSQYEDGDISLAVIILLFKNWVNAIENYGGYVFLALEKCCSIQPS